MMKPLVRLMAISAFVLLIAAPAAFAQAPRPESSTLPIEVPTEVGGTILQPGSYIIKVVSPVADRHKVAISKVDGEVVATVLTVPHHLEPGEKYPETTFVFFPTPAGQTRVLRTWFPSNPVSGHGHDIVYEASRLSELTRLTSQETTVVTETPMPAPAPVTSVTETEVTTTPVTTTPTPVPEPEPITETPMTSAAPDQETLPETAGEVPLVALLGLLSLGGAVLVRRARHA